jgi:hypothetical protein
MGYGTQFKSNIYLSRKYFENIVDLESQIEDVKESIEYIKQGIMMYAAASPDQCFPQSEEPIWSLQVEIRESLNLLSEYITELSDMERLRAYLKENPDIDVKKLNS